MKHNYSIKALVAALALWAMPAAAADWYLVVTETDGTEVAFPFADQPVITLADGEMSVASNANSLTVALGDVKCYTLVSELPTAVQTVTTASTAAIYTLDGKRLPGADAMQRGQVYIVRTANTTYKVLNK